MNNETGKKDKALLEQHYTAVELAKRWGFSARFVRELFYNEDGVIVIDRPERMHKRGYVSLRIPESVAERVYSRLVVRRHVSTSIAAPAARKLA
jgi:hypothetical protein